MIVDIRSGVEFWLLSTVNICPACLGFAINPGCCLLVYLWKNYEITVSFNWYVIYYSLIQCFGKIDIDGCCSFLAIGAFIENVQFHWSCLSFTCSIYFSMQCLACSDAVCFNRQCYFFGNSPIIITSCFCVLLHHPTLLGTWWFVNE